MARSKQSQAQAPLALAATAFAAGIWIAGHMQRSPVVWGWSTAALVLCSLAAVAIKNLRLSQAAAVLALVCAGSFARIATPAPRVVIPPPEFLSDYSKDKVEIVAHVTNDGALLAGEGPRERFEMEKESIEAGGVKFNQPVGIRATVYPRSARGHETNETVDVPGLARAYGERIHLLAKLRLPRNFGNPGAFDYAAYLRGHGIGVLASVRADEIEILPGTAGTRFGFWRSRMRNSILRHVREIGLWGREDAALFAAMIVGDDSMLLRGVREEFQQTGVYHLLVASGMNVALLAFAVFWLARRLRLPQWPASLLTIALSVFYAYIAGMGVPILRAVLMLSLFLVARLLYRDRSGLNATGFAALVVLVLSPAALFEPGFQLTFLALVAITGISLPILERTSTPYRSALKHLDTTGYDLGLEPKLAQFRLDLRLVAGSLQQFIRERTARIIVTRAIGICLGLFELLLVSSITQAVLVLPMRAYFHRAAIFGVPANILVLPLAGWMLNTGVTAIALSYVSLPFAKLAAMLAAGALHWTLGCLHLLSGFHVAQWRIPDPTAFLMFAALAGIVVAFLSIRKQRAMALAGLAALFLSSGVVATYHAAPQIESGKLEITAIDVGQGDSLLVVSPQGQTMLIDGGGSIGPVRSEFDFGEDVVAPYLWSRGLDHLDVIALTHAHGDHIGGLPRIIENFHPSELWVGINPQTDALRQLYEMAGENHVAIHRHVAGDEFNWS